MQSAAVVTWKKKSTDLETIPQSFYFMVLDETASTSDIWERKCVYVLGV